MAFTIKGGKFSTTDDDKTIRQSPVDEVIDILTAPTVGSGPPRGAPARAMRNVSAVSPQVNVQQLESLPPKSNNPAAMANIRDIANQVFDPARPQNFRDQESARMQGTVPLGLPSISVNPVSGVAYPEYSPRGGGSQAQGLGGYLGDQLFNIPTDQSALGANINPYKQFGDPLLGGDASTILGVNAFDKRAAELLGYDMETMEGVTKYLNDTKRSMENQERDQRLDDERRERAAMLAAQQQQPVDPCPEGYRLDPVSKVCVPTDDTTQPDNLATRTYDTMTRPEPNYTPATGFTLPAITLPDILG